MLRTPRRLSHRQPFIAALALLIFFAGARTLRADGGTVQLAEQVGGYQITVFTSPSPLRVGPVDVSVLVQDAAGGQAIAGDVRVNVEASLPEQRGAVLRREATHAAATNKLLRAGAFDLPEAGSWQLVVRVAGAPGEVSVPLSIEVGPAPPRWLSLWPWFCWPLLIIALFAWQQRVLFARTCRRGNGDFPGGGYPRAA